MNRSFGEGYYNSNSLLETKQYTREDVSEIIRCHPWLTCFSDHKLSFDLPFASEHAQVFAICFVRDPVDRFVSRYFFHRNFEEVNCIAQRMTFRQFAEAELVHNYVHPQTNSQIYFLNGGIDNTEMGPIHAALTSGRAYLFPIERFDDACICLERLHPTVFSDLSYVRTNVSKKDQTIGPTDREFVIELLKVDMPVVELAARQLDLALQRAFFSSDDLRSALAEFRDRCSRRYHNFRPPLKIGDPIPAQTDITSDSASNRTGSGRVEHKSQEPS
jgi:hypothetical protein